LAGAFLADCARRFAKPLSGFTARALEVLQAHRWPGNVRELCAAVEAAAGAARGGVVPEGAPPGHLPPRGEARPRPPPPPPPAAGGGNAAGRGRPAPVLRAGGGVRAAAGPRGAGEEPLEPLRGGARAGPRAPPAQVPLRAVGDTAAVGRRLERALKPAPYAL